MNPFLQKTDRERYFITIQNKIKEMLWHNFKYATLDAYEIALEFPRVENHFIFDPNVQDYLADTFKSRITKKQKAELHYLMENGANLLDILLHYRWELSPNQIVNALEDDIRIARMKMSEPVIELHKQVWKKKGYSKKAFPSITLQEYLDIRKSHPCPKRKFDEVRYNRHEPKESIKEFSREIKKKCKNITSEAYMANMYGFSPEDMWWHFKNRGFPFSRIKDICEEAEQKMFDKTLE